MLRTLLISVFLLVAGCVQIPPSPSEIQAKKFESVPGKAVIYIVRPTLGFKGHGTLTLDDSITITMFAGNFFRWEVAPGSHRIAGAAQDMSRITVQAQPGKIYFVEHKVTGFRGSTWGGYLELLHEYEGRAMVGRATLVGNG